MATILSSKKSTYGSPYAFYTVELTYSNRKETSVVVSYKITSKLQYEESWMGYALTANLTVGGTKSGAIKIKDNTVWSGTAAHTVSGEFTVTGLTATTASLSTSFSVSSASPDNSCQLSATSGSNLSISIFGKPTVHTLASTSVDLGESVKIDLSSRLLDSYMHTLTYTFGSASGTITTKTASASVSFTPPLKLAAEIPDKMSEIMTITCKTYTSSGTLIGTKEKELTVKVPSTAGTTPQLSVSSVDLGKEVIVYLSSRLSSEYKHTISYTLGNETKTIATKSTKSSLSFTPDMSLASEIPNAMSGNAVVKCTTYNSEGVYIGEKSVNLTLKVPDKAKTIPAVLVNELYLGETLEVDLSGRLVSAYKHSIKYELEGESYNVEDKSSSDKIEIAFSRDLAKKITKSESSKVIIKCDTYNGNDELVGTSSIIVQVKVPEDIVPTIQGITVTEASELVLGKFEDYVSTLSKLLVEIHAAGAENSEILTYTTSLGGSIYSGNNFTSNIIKDFGSIELETTVVDSRGRTATRMEEIEIVSYFEPEIDMELNTDENGITVQLKGRVADVNESNSKTLWVMYESADGDQVGEENVPLNDEEWVFEKTIAFPNLDLETTWQFVAELADKNTSKSTRMLTGVTALSRKAGGTGIAFGKDATQDGFDCNWSAVFRKDSAFEGNVSFGESVCFQKEVVFPDGVLLDLMYPVGSYYWNSNGTNPSYYFGGTWEQVKDKFILAAGSTYEAGSTGGAAKVTLTKSNMPAHTHTITVTANSVSGHTHSVSGNTDSAGAHTHTSQGYWSAGNGTAQAMSRKKVTDDPTDTNSLNSAGSHKHAISFTSGSGGGHTHTMEASASSVGSGTSHNNMPPYEVAYCWKRTA